MPFLSLYGAKEENAFCKRVLYVKKKNILLLYSNGHLQSSFGMKIEIFHFQLSKRHFPFPI